MVVDSQGKWTGIDVDVCRAVSAAIFGDSEKVKYVPVSGQQRFTALQSGEVDMLSNNTTVTLQRDTALGLDFGAVTYYDGQGFMVNRKLGVKSAKEINGASVCVPSGSTTELNLADFARANKTDVQTRRHRGDGPDPPGLLRRPLRRLYRRQLAPLFDARRQRAAAGQARGLHRPAGDHLQGAARARQCAMATTSSPTSCAGRSTPCSRPRNTASLRRTSTRC